MKRNNVNKFISALLVLTLLVVSLTVPVNAATYYDVTLSVDNDVEWYSSTSSTSEIDTTSVSDSATKTIYVQAPDGQYVSKVTAVDGEGEEIADVVEIQSYSHNSNKRYGIKIAKGLESDITLIAEVSDAEEVVFELSDVTIGTGNYANFNGNKVTLTGSLVGIAEKTPLIFYSDAFSANKSTDANGEVSYTASGLVADTTIYVESSDPKYTIVNDEVIYVEQLAQPSVVAKNVLLEDKSVIEKGSITISDYAAFENGIEYIVSANPSSAKYSLIADVENGILTDLTKGTYNVRAKTYYDEAEKTLYLASDYVTVSIAEDTVITRTIGISQNYPVIYTDLDGEPITKLTLKTGASVTLKVQPEDGYVIDGFHTGNVTASKADLVYDSVEGTLTISNPTDDFTIHADTRKLGEATNFGELIFSASQNQNGKGVLTVSGTFNTADGGAANADVKIYDGDKLLALVTTDETGTFTYAITTPATGSHIFKAVFAGNDDFDKSESIEYTIQVVKPDAPTVTEIIDTNRGEKAGSFSVENVALPATAEFEYSIDRNPDNLIDTTLLKLVDIGDGKATELSSGLYYARSKSFIDGITFYLPSYAQEVKITSVVANPPAVLRFYSLSLKGNIAVNYYMSLSDAVAADENAYMQFTMANEEVIQVAVSQAKKVEVDGNIYYVFSAQVAAKAITDEIQSQFFYTDGATEEYIYSVKQYADYILADTTNAYTQEVKDLVTAMLQYGAYAQIHFDYNTDNLAADLEAADLSGVTAETLQGFTGKSGQGTELASFYGSSLILESETTLRFFFRVDATVAENFTVTHNGVALEAKERSGFYYVDVTNISAKDLDIDITVTVNDGINSADVVYNPMTYCYNVLAADEGTYGQDLLDVVKALYLYNQAANVYLED